MIKTARLRSIVLLFLLFFLGIKRADAAVGCQANNGDIYITSPSGWFEWSNAMRSFCPNGATNSDQFAKFNTYTTNPATTCYIGFWGLGGNGKLVNYSLTNCPIDDYIPLLALGLAGVGVFAIKRRNVAILA